MSSKWTLDVVAMQEDFFADTSFVGLASPLPLYKLCWLINRLFDIQFTRDPDLDICSQISKDQQQFFPIYTHMAPLSGTSHHLYTLKLNNYSLLPEIKQLDYLWTIQSTSFEADALSVSQSLRNVPEIQLAQILYPDKLKNLSYLIL